MIIVLGSVLVKDGRIDEALEISQQHVERSRNEPGCIAHGVYLDSENSQRLVFVEKWSYQASLSQHFKESKSIEFVKNLEDFVSQAPEMSIYDTTQLK